MLKSYDKFIELAIENLTEKSVDFGALKKKISGLLQLPIPTNADLRERYEKLLLQKKIPRSIAFENLLLTRRIRTQSGVAVVAVLTKAYPCPGKCLYCPDETDMPKSYLSNEPAVMRAIDSKFNPYSQVQNRLRSLELNGHKTDKVELIVMGGTFSYLPKTYQRKFITECFRACNDYPRKVKFEKSENRLLKEQNKNEKSQRRIVGLTLETRPDYIDEKEIINFRNLGCTRVELGVQSIFDDVLKINKRGHDIQQTIVATKLLKDAGFKINYHIMPGLLGSSFSRDIQMFAELFSCADFQPDMLKIYPTVVVKNCELYSLWKKPARSGKKYVPLTDANFKKMILEIKNKIIPPYVRIARLVRDIPTTSIIAGPTLSNLRQIIIPESKCPCIRCREVGADFKNSEKIILDRIDYPASDGQEIFLQYVSEDKKKLFALLRLRIPSENNQHHFISALKNSALIREVHTYGKMTQINLPATQAGPQHIGLGKKLLLEAEKIAREEFGLQKIAVISGIGVRNYYRKLGYKLQNTYLTKKL